jgi:tetratricopeptide (TPR) repeat protein
MNRIESCFSSLAFLALAAASASAAPAKLHTAEEVLRQIERPAGEKSQASATESDGAKLLGDIQRYRNESAALAPNDAAARWFALYDRAADATPADAQMDFAAYDLAIMQAVGVPSMLASLPPPAAWREFRREAAQRAARAPSDREALALRFLAELLAGDRAAATVTLDTLDKIFGELPGDERGAARAKLALARAGVTKAYGSTAEIAAGFELEVRAGGNEYGYLEAPDLVGLVGEQRAAELLKQAISGASTLRIQSGDATRKLARRLALENIGNMRVPQWQLADSVDSAALYEAIERRFDPASANSARADESAQQPDRDYRSSEATAWYFLASVIAGKQSDAERALVKLSRGGSLYIPRDAVQALRRAGQDDALFRFLHAQLERRPEIGAWDLYIEQAAYTGHSADSLALIEAVLARKTLPEFLAADLKVRRVSALLAADKVDAAADGLRNLLAKPPTRGESTLTARYNAALKAAALGRLTGRRALTDLGLRFALAAAQAVPDSEEGGRSEIDTVSLWRELREAGRATEVQALAIADLGKIAGRTGFQALAPASPTEISALVELAGIWSAEGKHAEVLRLLDQSTRWSVKDAGALLANTDSEKLPLGVMIARALQASGDKEGALRVARATVSQLPGFDAGYELLATLDPMAPATFDALFARDQFEERPLIWKAVVQIKAGATADAEATVRRAISIDPSDGEQGVNDRMRAYAVLSDILKRKGDDASAATYAKAVEAIRLSETADSYYAAGLYERAFKGYREALEHFSDAYCIQSRLAVQLNKVGRRTEALEHYRRAYELMPDSFGRVESHCFGCESVFQGTEAQSLAEQVFTDVVRKSPAKAQAYYLLAYLREQQDRPADAVQPLRQAVSLDPQYLNAWAHINQVGARTWIEPGELDIARLKLLELDPLRRHVQYDLKTVGNLPGLWSGAERAHRAAEAARPIRENVYALRASREVIDTTRASLPPEMRAQMEQFENFQNFSELLVITPPAPVLLGQHSFVTFAKALMGIGLDRDY